MTNIKEISLSTGKWLAVTTADYFYEDSLNLDSEPDEDGNIWLCYQVPDGFNEKSECIKLPSGHTYTLIGKASELSEDKIAFIVEVQWEDLTTMTMLTKNYLTKQYEYDLSYMNSFLSLLRAYGLNPDTCVIIQQQ